MIPSHPTCRRINPAVHKEEPLAVLLTAVCLLQAVMTVDESVRGILQVLPNLVDEHNGTLVDWKGKKLPW